MERQQRYVCRQDCIAALPEAGAWAIRRGRYTARAAATERVPAHSAGADCSTGDSLGPARGAQCVRKQAWSATAASGSSRLAGSVPQLEPWQQKQGAAQHSWFAGCRHRKDAAEEGQQTHVAGISSTNTATAVAARTAAAAVAAVWKRQPCSRSSVRQPAGTSLRLQPFCRGIAAFFQRTHLRQLLPCSMSPRPACHMADDRARIALVHHAHPRPLPATHSYSRPLILHPPLLLPFSRVTHTPASV